MYLLFRVWCESSVVLSFELRIHLLLMLCATGYSVGLIQTGTFNCIIKPAIININSIGPTFRLSLAVPKSLRQISIDLLQLTCGKETLQYRLGCLLLFCFIQWIIGIALIVD